jgi:hypothetical protein
MTKKTLDIIHDHADVLADTVVATEGGKLIVVHHATNCPFDTFSKTSDMGFHFGSYGQAAKRRRNMISRGEAAENDEWRVVSCVLAMRNPLVIPDDPGAWNLPWLTATLARFLEAEDKYAIRAIRSRVAMRGANGPADKERDALVRQWFAVLRGAIRRAGHDGIVYRNVFEATGRAMEWSWMVFDDSQIVRLPGVEAIDELAADIRTAPPPNLRAAGPMRELPNGGPARLKRGSDVARFREVVEAWAREEGLEWTRKVKPGTEPEFGIYRSPYDLETSLESEFGIAVKVSSEAGQVEFAPMSSERTTSDLLRDFRSDASEAFFLQDVGQTEDVESIRWQPGETLAEFRRRLDDLYVDLTDAFSHGTMPTAPRPSL